MAESKCMYCTDEHGFKNIEPTSIEVVYGDDFPHKGGSSAVEEFLTRDGRSIEMMVGYENAVIWIGSIESDGDGSEYRETGVTFNINFCPICGRKLN